MNPIDDALKLLQIGKLDDDLPLALRGGAQLHDRAERVSQGLFQTLVVARLDDDAALGFLAHAAFLHFLDEVLGLPHRESLERDALGGDHLHRPLKSQERTGVPHLEFAASEHRLDLFVETKEPQQVRGG